MNIIPSTTKDPAPNGIDPTTKLTRTTRLCIEKRIEQLEEVIETEGEEHGAAAAAECRDSWASTIAELQALLKTPTHGLLSQSALAFEELELEREVEPAVHRDLNRAERIEAKRDWDRFIAEGGDPSSITVTTFRQR